MNDKLRKVLEAQGNPCRRWRADTDTCTTGCPKSDVIKGNTCPWSEDWVDAKQECACYKG